jgi:hypothetical protein
MCLKKSLFISAVNPILIKPDYRFPLSVIDVVVTSGAVVIDTLIEVVLSEQPNHPGVSHVDVDVGVGVAVGISGVVETMEVVLSKHPNHPGVWQVEVDVEVVVVVVISSVVVIGMPVVVVLSKQPHHPGVWHVDVLVIGVDVDVEVVVVVVISDPLLLKYFHS